MKARLILAILVLNAVVAVAQDDPQRRVLLNTVSVAADGKFEAAPDTALLNFTVGAQDKDSKQAYEKAQRAAERMRQALRDSGIDPKAAELSGYALQPQYDWRSGRAKVVGFLVTTGVNLKLKDFSKVGPIITALSLIEETQNQSVAYILENMESAKQKAVEDAFNKARASAGTVAKTGGRSLGDLAYASVDTFEQQPPIPMYDRAQMKGMRAEAAQAPTEEFTAQRVTVTARVNALFNLK